MRGELLVNIIANVISTAVFIIVVLEAFSGRISVGDVTLYTNAVKGVQRGLRGVIFNFAVINRGIMMFSEYTELMALPQPVYVTKSPCNISALVSGIEFRKVSFRYTEDHPWVLKDINLIIPANKSLALVGLNGAGKTTLVKLLTRLYDPSNGVILWDGVDLRDFNPRDLRARMGTIFQDFIHYDLTVQENIGLGDVSQMENMESIRQATSKAGIASMIEDLPDGYQTILSRWLAEDCPGAELSGGEWQKIAIARMLMRDSDLLIMDEPTAALDAQAEYEIYHQFAELVTGRTSLLISHRFSTVRMVDIIAVLEKGTITEHGSHDELCSLGGRYSRLYKMQADRYT